MVFAARRIFSSSVLRSFSSDSAAPISLSCSRRRKRSRAFSTLRSPGSLSTAARLETVLIGGREARLLDANGPHLSEVGDALHDLLDPVHLQRAHAFVERRREHLRDPRVLLDVLLDRVGPEQQLVQADAALVASVRARLTSRLAVQRELTLVVAVIPEEILVHPLVATLRVLLELGRVEQLLAILLKKLLDLLGAGAVGLLALRAEPLGEALREDPDQRVGEVERVHAH